MVRLRRAATPDSDAVASLHRIVRAVCLPFLPSLHSEAEDRWYFRERVFPVCTVWVAENEGRAIRGFAAFRLGWLDHLYVDPAWHGRGLGTALLDQAMNTHDGLQLWAFQANGQARRFYERRGFRAVEFTDGTGNEERQPDVRYQWSRT